MHTFLLCTSYLSCSFPVRRAVDIFKDRRLFSIVKQWLASFSGSCMCSTCHLCVLELNHFVCTSVCGSTLSLPVKSSAVAPAVLEGYHLCVGVNVGFLASVPWTTRVPLLWLCTFESAPLSHVSTTWNIPTFTRRLTWTHTVFFSFSVELDTLSGDSNHSLTLQLSPPSLTSSLYLYLSLSSLFYLHMRRSEWRLLGQNMKWTYRVTTQHLRYSSRGIFSPLFSPHFCLLSCLQQSGLNITHLWLVEELPTLNIQGNNNAIAWIVFSAIIIFPTAFIFASLFHCTSYSVFWEA